MTDDPPKPKRTDGPEYQNTLRRGLRKGLASVLFYGSPRRKIPAGQRRKKPNQLLEGKENHSAYGKIFRICYHNLTMFLLYKRGCG